MRTRRYPKPAILRGIPADRSAVIEASAGTGKTYTLEHLLIELILVRRLPLERILVVTFTEKATGELVARLRAKLTELLNGAWAEPDAELSDADCWLIDEPARAVLAQALSMFDSATISTIHSFCQRVLTEHAFTHERLFEQTQVKDTEAFGLAFHVVLRTTLACDLVLAPWLRALLAEGWTAGDLEDHLLACWKSPGALRPVFDPIALGAALAFFRAPLDRELLVSGFDKMHPATRKALWTRLDLLAGFAARHAQDDDLSPLLVDVQRRKSDFYTSSLAEALPKANAISEPGRALQRAVATLYPQLVSLEAVAANLFLPVVRAEVERQKRAAGQFDFQDMLSLVKESLDGPRGDELVRDLRERYACALIDEFQDTDPVQWAIFKRVFFDSGASHPLLVIGDPKQSIYAFRGADVHTYVAARSAIVAAGGPALVLDENFRSTPALIAAYNEIFAEHADGGFFSGDIRYDAPVRPGRPRLQAVDSAGAVSPAIHLLCPDPRAPLSADLIRQSLGRRIADEIHTLLDRGPQGLRFGEGEDLQPLRPSDIFVLTKSAKEGIEMAEHLRAAGLPYAFFKQDGLFQREEAADVLALLQAIDAPEDSSRRARAWLSPFFGVSLSELAGLRELPSGHPLKERLYTWRALAETRSYDQLFARIVSESGILRRELFFSESERALTNYVHLFEILLEEAGRSRGTLAELAHKLAGYIAKRDRPEGEDEGVQRLETERQAVQLLTIHKSKGLEAAVVFLYGAFADPGDRAVKSYRQAGQRLGYVGAVREREIKPLIERESIEEAQRLLYVAITRAKARLYLPYFHTLDPPAAPGESFAHLGVAYEPLNLRLRALWNHEASGFARHRVPIEAAPEQRSNAPIADLSAWRPEPALLAPRDESGRYHALRPRHAGFVVTSYTRLKGAEGGYHAASVDRGDAASPSDELGVLAPTRGVDELAGGKASGIFLHAVLEALSFPACRTLGSPEAFYADPEVDAVFLRHLRESGRDPRQLPHAKRLVAAGLYSPIALPEGGHIARLVEAARVRKEMEFIYPIPERSHPTLAIALGAALDARCYAVERGFIKGYLDLLFEHEGRVFVLDWKSDVLPSWDQAALANHVEANYRLQAKLYSLALAKLLGLHDQSSHAARFGGFVYTFLRGMSAAPGVEPAGVNRGVYTERPTWSTLLAWETELREHSLPGTIARSRA